MRMERSGNSRGRGLPRPHTYISEHPAQNECFRIYGVLKREECTSNISRWGNMKFAYRNREFWCKGYYVDTVGKNTKAIKTYIAEQLKRDQESDQLSIFDPRDPFMGSK